jgi:hypothetical protein
MYARGTIVGLTRGSTRAHLARAALEGIAYQVKDLLDAMEKDAGHTLRLLRVDGGASVSRFLMQFQADILRRPIDRPKLVEPTALGAAFQAGLYAGLWPDIGRSRTCASRAPCSSRRRRCAVRRPLRGLAPRRGARGRLGKGLNAAVCCSSHRSGMLILQGERTADGGKIAGRRPFFCEFY